MTRYLNLGGDSGIVGYEIGVDSILLEFNSGWKYLYDYAKPGRGHVDQMKQLALIGKGLNGYLKRNVGTNFQDKYR